jgi:hemin uptake protein HemP
MTMEENPRETAAASEPPKPSQELVRSQELFQGRREIWIEHDGERYRLRITRRNKLILQK